MSSSSPPETPSLHIAGIGASAGGIEAMLPMFARLPATGRIAYIVAQHMAHNGHSDLVARLLGRESALPVTLARDGERLLADTVYVIPAGKDGCVRDGVLTLQAPGSGNLSTPSVNALFASIGEARRDHAVGIVLSGTGADGTVGCRAIKSYGGLTIAQEPNEAKFDGMPGAAIEARVIDRVLPVEAIGDALAELFPAVARPPATATAGATPSVPAPSAPAIDPGELHDLERLLHLVHSATGIDFSGYKEETLLRRLEKRKAALGVAGTGDYFALVARQPDELRILQQLFLVSVSSFFRDRDAFRELERALAAVVAGKRDGEPIRVWVPGCASGDECYSLAVILTELLGPYRDRHAVQIVGTDISPEALAAARAGIYRQTALREVDADLRERYFISRGQHFEVVPLLRDCVSFEQCDALAGASTPPAGELDLVSCRNLLIYLKSGLQDRLIESFHQALRPQGLLFVGQAESLGVRGDSLFAAVDRCHRLFRRRH